jgi:hypothetical protein
MAGPAELRPVLAGKWTKKELIVRFEVSTAVTMMIIISQKMIIIKELIRCHLKFYSFVELKQIQLKTSEFL